MKISSKLILLFSISSIVPLIVIGSVSTIISSKALNKQTASQLSSLADRQASRLQVRNDRNHEILGVLNSKLRFKLLLESYTAQPSSATLSELQSIIVSYRQEKTTVRNIIILNKQGIVVASTDQMLVGKDYTGEEVYKLISANKVSSVFRRSNNSQSGELLQGSKVTISGKQIGSAIIEFEINSYTDVLQDYQQLGLTGETAIVAKRSDGRYYYELPVRFNNTGGIKPANTEAIKKLDTYNNKELLSFQDYRDATVLGTLRSLPDTDWKVLVSINKEEVLAPVVTLQRYILVTFIGVLVAGIISAIFFSRIITRPLKRFTTTARKIEAGDLTRRVQVTSGDELGMLGAAFNNMTDHLVKSNATLGSSIAGLTQGFLIVERSGKIDTINKAAMWLLGKHSHPTHFADAMKGLAGADWESQLKKCIATGKVLTFKNVSYKGSSYYVYISPVIANEKVLGAAIQIIDLTEEKILQRSRDEFFSIASHELRTPLTAIRGNSDMVKKFYADKINDTDFNEMVDDIHISAIRLIEIVNDFLDASSLEQGKIKYELTPLAIQNIISEVIYENAANAGLKNVKLLAAPGVADAPLVLADKNRTKQILYNLIGNALKFTESGSITISTVQESGHVKIFVTDTGGGISETNQKLLFHKFQQASTSLYTRDAARGTGLGLYISKLLTSQMGGHLQLEKSTPGVGTTFCFTLQVVKN